ncbi:MAG: hypothetical protein NTV57_13155 [Cyanobacteria bacterium]|nr:hypothetical protein [Cyanobacteriota bacterium]
MTVLNSRVEPPPAPGASVTPERALVLVGFGLAGAPAAAGLPPLLAVAHQLADLLALPLHRLSPLDDPNSALAARRHAAASEGDATSRHPDHGPGWVEVLEVDAGLALPPGGSWAEALGAWRQPCVLVIEAGQLATGWPAAGTALLQHWRVPLLGLLQWGGTWDAMARRRDGLPWLGIVAGTEAGDGRQSALAAVLALRWRQLDLG